MNMITAIQIDPFELTVKPVEYDASDYRNVYPLLSHETMKVDHFDAARANTLADGDAIFVDGEGLMKACDRYFQVVGCPETLVGKGLIIGSDSHGNERSAQTPMKNLRIVFFTLRGADLVPTAMFNGKEIIKR
jgi:hypothetical protein